MQRKINDIVVDLDFIARGLDLAAGRDGVNRAGQTPAAGDSPDFAGSRMDNVIPARSGEATDMRDARFARLRRQQDLIAAMADEIASSAIEACRALQYADANANVSALCDYRDPDLRGLVTELARRRDQLHNSLVLDREKLEIAASASENGAESAPAGEAVAAADEISKKALDRGDGEMF